MPQHHLDSTVTETQLDPANAAEILRDDIEAVINTFLDNGKDYGIEFSSNNEILRRFVHTAVDMMED